MLQASSVVFFSHLFQCSLRQRRELRGDVRPRQPPERGHPAQLHQHLQRGQLLLLLRRRPSRHRPVQRRHHHHNKPEHRGEPAAEGRHPVSAFRELIFPNSARASTLERSCLLNLSDTQRKGILSLLQFGPHCFYFNLNWFVYVSSILSSIGNAFENAMFSLESMKTKEQAL